MKFYKYKKWSDSYHSKNNMWIIDDCEQHCSVSLRKADKKIIEVAIFEKAIYGNKTFQKCIDYVNRVCKEVE